MNGLNLHRTKATFIEVKLKEKEIDIAYNNSTRRHHTHFHNFFKILYKLINLILSQFNSDKYITKFYLTTV